jgi:hypothetical protein
VFPHQRRQRPEISFGQSALPMGLGEDLLEHEGVHVDHAILRQVQRQHADLLVFAAIARHFVATSQIDEAVCAVPSLDGVEPLVDFAAQRQAIEVAGKEDRLDRAAELGERRVGRVLTAGGSIPNRSGLVSTGCRLGIGGGAARVRPR